jgi:hypothetical protein
MAMAQAMQQAFLVYTLSAIRMISEFLKKSSEMALTMRTLKQDEGVQEKSKIVTQGWGMIGGGLASGGCAGAGLYQSTKLSTQANALRTENQPAAAITLSPEAAARPVTPATERLSNISPATDTARFRPLSRNSEVELDTRVLTPTPSRPPSSQSSEVEISGRAGGSPSARALENGAAVEGAGHAEAQANNAAVNPQAKALEDKATTANQLWYQGGITSSQIVQGSCNTTSGSAAAEQMDLQGDQTVVQATQEATKNAKDLLEGMSRTSEDNAKKAIELAAQVVSAQRV